MSEKLDLSAYDAAWKAVIDYATDPPDLWDDIHGYFEGGLYEEESYDRDYGSLDEVRDHMAGIGQLLESFRSAILAERKHRTLTWDEADAVRALHGKAKPSVVSSGFGISEAMVLSIWAGISFPEGGHRV